MMTPLQAAVAELVSVYDEYFAVSDLLRADGERVLDDPRTDEVWRRQLVRVSWPMIEAYSFSIRWICSVLVNHSHTELSEKNCRLLAPDDRSYGAAERIKRTIRLAYGLHELDGCPSFAGKEWAAALAALKVRDRITHPKSAADLAISDEEWPTIHAGTLWALRLHTGFFDEVNARHGQPD